MERTKELRKKITREQTKNDRERRKGKTDNEKEKWRETKIES